MWLFVPPHPAVDPQIFPLWKQSILVISRYVWITGINTWSCLPNPTYWLHKPTVHVPFEHAMSQSSLLTSSASSCNHLANLCKSEPATLEWNYTFFYPAPSPAKTSIQDVFAWSKTCWKKLLGSSMPGCLILLHCREKVWKRSVWAVKIPKNRTPQRGQQSCKSVND